MNLASPQSASTPEVSSFPPSTRRKLWTSTRSISVPPSPSTLSAVSEPISDVSHFEFTTTEPSNSSPDHLHSHPEPTITSHLPYNLPDPTTHLSITQLSLPTSPPPIMNNHMYPVSPLAQMPLRHMKQAPPLFKGDYQKVTRFIEHYTYLLEHFSVTSDQDKCRGILEYCSQDVEDFITSCPDFIEPDWEALKEEILKYYDAERMDNRIQLPDLIRFLQEQVREPMTTLSHWKKYNRRYLAYAGFLKRNGQIDETEYHGYFWYGIPESMRSILEVKLQTKYPAYDASIEPWSITRVQDIAESHLKRNTFSDKLYHLPALGVKKRYEDEEDEEEDDDDDDDDYEEERRYRKKKKTPKKKSKTTNPNRGFPPLPPLKEETSRRIVPPPEDGRIEEIIHQLNTMSLEDPRYGSLYYKAVKDDRSGLAAQCITRRPQQQTLGRPTPRDPPPHQNQPVPIPDRPPYPRGVLPYGDRFAPRQIPKCYGCYESGHVLRSCPKISNMLLNKAIVLDNDFKYRFPDGQLIVRRLDESLVQCIERLRPPQQHQVQYAAIKDAVSHYYNGVAKRDYQQFREDDSDEESEDDEEEEEENVEEEDLYEDGHWSQRSQRRHEYPQYVAYEAIDEEDRQDRYEAYPAERGDKATRQARTTAMNNPVKKTRFDGVWMPPRKTRAMENVPAKAPERISEPVPLPPKPVIPPTSKSFAPFKPKENIAPPDIPPIPVDARRPRVFDSSDVAMKEPEPALKETGEERRPVVLQDYSN